MEDFLRDSPFEESGQSELDPSTFPSDNPAFASYNYTPQTTSELYNVTLFDNYNVAPQFDALAATHYDPTVPQTFSQTSYNDASGMPANDPYFEAFDFLASPTNQPASPVQLEPHDTFDPIHFGGDAGNNLDQLISPDNNATFPSAQYFLPPTRAETLAAQFSGNVLSPGHLRHGSVSVAPPEQYLLPNAYLLPVTAAFDASDIYGGLFDTLKSPYLPSYLSLPPPLALASTSIPGKVKVNAVALPPDYGLGMSAPTSSGHSKHMTQEEKVKRRREFHNAVERRRRDLIKEKIKELGQLVPPLLLTPQACAVETFQKPPYLVQKDIKELMAGIKVKDSKPNKATILLTSVDYIRHLQYVLAQQLDKRAELEREIANLEGGGYGAVGYGPPPEFNPDDFFSDVITDRTAF